MSLRTENNKLPIDRHTAVASHQNDMTTCNFFGEEGDVFTLTLTDSITAMEADIVFWSREVIIDSISLSLDEPFAYTFMLPEGTHSFTLSMPNKAYFETHLRLEKGPAPTEWTPQRHILVG